MAALNPGHSSENVTNVKVTDEISHTLQHSLHHGFANLHTTVCIYIIHPTILSPVPKLHRLVGVHLRMVGLQHRGVAETVLLDAFLVSHVQFDRIAYAGPDVHVSVSQDE